MVLRQIKRKKPQPLGRRPVQFGRLRLSHTGKTLEGTPWEHFG